MKRSKSPGASSKKRSRSATSVKSKSGGGPSRRSSRKSSAGKYSKLRGTEPGEDEIEMVDLNQINFGALAIKDIGKGGEMRPHEIYENTQYIPNKELRLLNIPLNSSLSFQITLAGNFFSPSNSISFSIKFNNFSSSKFSLCFFATGSVSSGDVKGCFLLSFP